MLFSLVSVGTLLFKCRFRSSSENEYDWRLRVLGDPSAHKVESDTPTAESAHDTAFTSSPTRSSADRKSPTTSIGYLSALLLLFSEACASRDILVPEFWEKWQRNPKRKYGRMDAGIKAVADSLNQQGPERVVINVFSSYHFLEVLHAISMMAILGAVVISICGHWLHAVMNRCFKQKSPVPLLEQWHHAFLLFLLSFLLTHPALLEMLFEKAFIDLLDGLILPLRVLGLILASPVEDVRSPSGVSGAGGTPAFFAALQAASLLTSMSSQVCSEGWYPGESATFIDSNTTSVVLPTFVGLAWIWFFSSVVQTWLADLNNNRHSDLLTISAVKGSFNGCPGPCVQQYVRYGLLRIVIAFLFARGHFHLVDPTVLGAASMETLWPRDLFPDDVISRNSCLQHETPINE